MRLHEVFDEYKDADIACCYSEEEIAGFITKLERAMGILFKSREEEEERKSRLQEIKD